MPEPGLIAALAVIAFLYSVVGHAGASGYIAILALAGQSSDQIKPLALLLNTVVASIGCWNFIPAGHLPRSRFWWVYVLATPAAFLGGWLHLSEDWFRRLIGLVLLFAAWRLGSCNQDPNELKEPRAVILFFSGGGLGLLAGLTGTGGGVFLTPLLMLCRWCTTRQAAAVSVLFILLNSLAGLAGMWWAKPEIVQTQLQPQLLVALAAVAIAGGIGSRLGSRHWPVGWIRRVLALVMVVAAIKLLGIS